MNWNPMMGPPGASTAPQSPDLGALVQAFVGPKNSLGVSGVTLGNPKAQEQYRQMAEAFVMQQRAAQDQERAKAITDSGWVQNSGPVGVLNEVFKAYVGKKLAKRADEKDIQAREKFYLGEEAAAERKAQREADRQAATTARKLEIIRRGDKAEMLANGIELPKVEQYKPDWKERRKADGSTEWFDINGGPPQSQASAGLDKPGYGAAQFDPEAFYADVGNLIGSHGGRITSTSDGKHNAGSKHYDGGAVDVGMGRESPEQQQAIIDALSGDPRFVVRDERTRPDGQKEWSGPHLHIEPRFAQTGGQQAGPRIVPGNAPQSKELSEYRTLSQQEVAGLGLPQGTVAQMSPTGQVQIVNKPRDLPAGGQVVDNGDGTTTFIPAGKISEGERNAAGFYSRMTTANNEMKRLTGAGYDPTNLRDFLTVDSVIGNYGSSTEGQQYHQAAMNWVRANLRKESGAAIGKDEAQQEIRNYFPRPGDSKEVIAQKARNRETVEQAMRTAAGGALPPPVAPQSEQGKRDAHYKGPAKASTDDDLINKYLRP